jgi:hypothetical protein
MYRDGTRVGGQPFSRGALYALLSNPIYVGEIAHKGARYPGQHEAILDRATWDQVQEQLRTAAPARNGRVTGGISPLIGKLFDEAGHRLTPSHARKKGRKYRYYVSRSLVTGTAEQSPGAWRIPATQIEMLVANEAAMALADPGAVAAALEQSGVAPEKMPRFLAAAAQLRDDLNADTRRSDALARIVHRIELSPIRLRVILSLSALAHTEADAIAAGDSVLIRELAVRTQRRGVEMRLVIEAPSAPANCDPVLLKEIRRAHRCFDALLSRRVGSIDELAGIEGVSDRYVSSLLPLAFLAPDIVDAVAAGRQPANLTAHRLIRSMELPISWGAQKQLLGFS